MSHNCATMTNGLRISTSRPIEDESSELDWTLALAGGEGTRLSEYVERRFGQRMPKQYCRLLGSRSMLQHTLERLNKLTPPSRTMTVIALGGGRGGIRAGRRIAG